MNLRSPLGQVLGSGSAKDGTRHWWAQRVSAIGLVMLGLWFLFALLQMDGFGYRAVSEWLARPVNGVLVMLLSLTLAYHSSLGIQVIVEDYVHGKFLKIASLMLSDFAHLFVAVAALYSVMRIALGASA